MCDVRAPRESGCAKHCALATCRMCVNKWQVCVHENFSVAACPLSRVRSTASAAAPSWGTDPRVWLSPLGSGRWGAARSGRGNRDAALSRDSHTAGLLSPRFSPGRPFSYIEHSVSPSCAGRLCCELRISSR